MNRLGGCLIWFFSIDVKTAPAEDTEHYKNMLLRDVDNLDKAISALLGKAGHTSLTGGSSVSWGRGRAAVDLYFRHFKSSTYM